MRGLGAAGLAPVPMPVTVPNDLTGFGQEVSDSDHVRPRGPRSISTLFRGGRLFCRGHEIC
jgi:hypothetical protein